MGNNKRAMYTAKGYEHVKRQNGLAIVVTKDPYNWSLDMCRNPYILKWLDGSSSDKSSVDAACLNMSTKVYAWGVHDNILEFWNLWHRKYAFEYPHPRIMIRLEDLTFRPWETVKRICDCAGGITTESFHHFIDSAKSMGWQKGHGPKEELTGMIKAWPKDHFRVRGVFRRIITPSPRKPWTRTSWICSNINILLQDRIIIAASCPTNHLRISS